MSRSLTSLLTESNLSHKKHCVKKSHSNMAFFVLSKITRSINTE